jgi:SAM-dependent methyltransferase
MVAVSERCGACGSSSTAEAFSAGDLALRAVSGTYSYRRCLACGSVFAAPQPPPGELAEAYASSYGLYCQTSSKLERLLGRLALPEVRRVMRSADPSGELIDLGCGNGRFLERLRGCGWTGRLQGFDFAAPVAAATRERTGLEISVGNLNEEILPPDSYDAIVLRHVIEHVRRPLDVLQMVRAALRPGGVLYVATPDLRAFSRLVFGRYWWGYDVPRHLVIFSAPALLAAMRWAGFEPIDRWYGFSPQMWGASLGLALADHGAPARLRQLCSSPANPVTMAVFSLSTCVEVLLGRSTMLSVVARRQHTRA